MVANRIAGVGARESTRQRRHTACKCARMWLAAGALVALAAQKTNTFFPCTHHDIQRVQALGVLLRSGSIGLVHCFGAFDGCAASGEGPCHVLRLHQKRETPKRRQNQARSA
jgi:hypothetical protein